MTDSYVCPLSEKSLKKAKEELSEDPKERLSAMNTFKNWILEQPHITCPTDPVFLLAFLRARKFSQLEARKLLEKFLTMKTKHKEWFDDIDPMSPPIQAILNDGFMCRALKNNAEGQSVMLCSFPKLQPWKGNYTSLDICRLMVMMTYDTFMSDEELQVNGIIVFDDLTGMTMKHQTMFSLDEQKTFFGGWHRSIPARIKKILMYNVGAFGEFLMSIAKLTMPESLQERLINCGSNMENIYKEIPMELLPEEYLPDDYKGQNGGKLKDLIECYRAGVSSPERRERIRYLSDSKFRINEAKRPKDVASESFRKLSVD